MNTHAARLCATAPRVSAGRLRPQSARRPTLRFLSGRFTALRILTTILLALGICAFAHADPITYTLTGTFSGSLGSQSFTDVSGSIVFTGDSSGATTPGGGFYTNTAGISTITLEGVGTATFLSPTFGAESETNGAGFFDSDINSGFGTSIYDPAMGDYALSAPFSDTGYLMTSFATAFGATEATDHGDLSLTVDGGTGTFTAATPSANPSPTPEPGGLTLLGTGLLGIAAIVRRSMRRSR